MTIPTWDDFGASLVLHANLSIAHLIFGVDNEATIPGLANESAKVFAHVTHVSTSYIYIYLGKKKYIYIYIYIYIHIDLIICSLEPQLRHAPVTWI